MKHSRLKVFLSIGLVLIAVSLFIPRTAAQENSSEMDDAIDLVVGDITSVSANSLTRVSVTNPDVADISDAQSDKVSVLAKKAGETVLFLWDASGKRDIKVHVINEDLTILKQRLKKLIDEANITGISLEENHNEGKVVVSGALPKDDKDRLADILAPYSDDILNLVKEEKNNELIQVDMQIVEISTSLEKNLGILWGSPGTSTTSVTANGSTTTTSSTANTNQINLNYNEVQPSSNGHISDFFKIGNFYRTSPLEATVNALVQEGKAKLISRPRLVVVSGKQASFLVGGEIPVESTTTSASGGVTQSNTTYSQYGVNLTMTPTIREGKIDIVLNVDIRDIDSSNSTNGNVAFITRNAQTDLLMDNKQTLALAGLIKYSASEQITKIPILGDIPLLGALFRDRQTPSPDTNTELVIVLTPTVLTDKKYTNKEMIMPTSVEEDALERNDSKYNHEYMPSWPVVKSSDEQDPQADVSATTAYARMVQAKISREITYPTYVGIGWAGTVKLKLHILKDGSLDAGEVVGSSGV